MHYAQTSLSVTQDLRTMTLAWNLPIYLVMIPWLTIAITKQTDPMRADGPIMWYNRQSMRITWEWGGKQTGSIWSEGGDRYWSRTLPHPEGEHRHKVPLAALNFWWWARQKTRSRLSKIWTAELDQSLNPPDRCWDHWTWFTGPVAVVIPASAPFKLIS